MSSVSPAPRPRRPEIDEALAVARTLRGELGLASADALPCVLEVVEERLALDTVILSLPDSVSGFFMPVRPRAVIVINSGHPVQRQRFTLAHELGHYVLGHAASPRIQETTTGAAATPADAGAGAPPPAPVSHYAVQRASDPNERGANAFAGELLVPEHGTRKLARRWADQPLLDQVVRLSSHFGVSAFAAAVKLQQIGVADYREFHGVRAELQAGLHLPRYDQLGLQLLDDRLQRFASLDAPSYCSAAAGNVIRRLRREADADAELA